MVSMILRIVERNLSPLAWVLLALVGVRWVGDRRQLDYSMEHVPRGGVHLYLHQWPDAANRFRMALVCDPESHEAWSGLAVACREMGQFDHAFDAHDQAIRLSPYLARYRMQKADTFAKAGRYREALAELQPLKARKYDRSDPAHEMVLAMVEAYRKLDEMEPALDLLDEALVRAPDDKTLLKARAETCALVGDHRQALADLQRAVRLAPNDTDLAQRIEDVRRRIE